MIEYPKVTALVYRILSDEQHQYAEAAERNGTLRDFTYRLHHRDARFMPNIRFADGEQARAALEPQLKAWELFTALRYGLGTLQFRFLTAQIQQEAPVPGVVQLAGAALVATGGQTALTHTFNEHPPPPEGFAVDECVQTLGDLFLLARTAPVMVLYIAYSMTTCLEYYYGRLASAAERLAISGNVFDKIDEYANSRGIGAEARKFDPNVQRKPLVPAEREWLVRVLEEIVRRAGVATAGAAQGGQITLATMPPPAP